MKNIYIFFALIISLNIQAQLGFQEHVLNDESELTYSPSFLVDINNDGFMDVITRTSKEIKWFKNIDGLGNFDTAKLVVIGLSNITSYDVKDIDGDGFLDVVVTYYQDNLIVWFKNDGQGNFGSAQTIVNVDRPRELSLVDIDGDGFMDILVNVGLSNQRVSWYKNDGLGNFGVEQIISTLGNNVHFLQAGDIDGDGDLDIFFLNSSSDTMVWYENLNGLGNYGQINNIQTYGSPRNISLVDLDGDGHLDILYSESIILTTQYTIGWYRNLNGQGSFNTHQTLFSYSKSNNSGISALTAFDISGNGNMDLLIDAGNSNQTKTFWHENLGGQNNFGPEQTIITEVAGLNYHKNHFDFGDINGDGDKDLLCSSGNLIWFESTNGQGSFGNKNIINRYFGPPSSASITDINNNLDNDLIISFNNKVVVYENNNNNFNVKQIIDKGNRTVTSDIDDDGFEDLIIVEKLINGHNLSWYKNDGQGTFGNALLVSTNTTLSSHYIKSIYAFDINNNGVDDILAVFSDTNNSNFYRIVWFENDGLGNFMPEQLILQGTNQISSVYPADINNDGHMDIVTASIIFGINWLENDGQGNFSSIQSISSSPAHSVFAVDINGNGFIDVLSTYSSTNGSILLHKNLNGLGNFDPPQTIDYNLHLPFSVYATDLNNNGYMDIISTFPGKIVWYENLNGQNSFSAEKIISLNAQFPSVILSGEVFGTGKTDLISLSGGDEKVILHENLGYLGNQIFGNIKLDTNANGCDPNDLPLGNLLVVADNGTNSFSTFTQANGDYYIQTNASTFTTSISSQFPTYFDSNPLTHSSNFTGLGNTAIADFCVTSNQNVNDLNVSIYPLTDARPGFDADYQIVYSNIGSTIMSGNVILEYDNNKINLLNASQTINSQTANTLTFNYTSLKPFETRTIDVHFNVAAPPITDINDILIFEAIINPVSGDNSVNDNTYIFQQTVIGSYDPNDIRVVEGEEIYLDEVENYLHYIIRFQNSGTADAINVVVENELDNNLDWSTLQIQTISHDNRVEIKDGSLVRFIFENIHLPDNLSNEPASHGHITYKIKPKPTLVIGDFVNNTAAIFFDFNPPIITNTVKTTVVEALSIQENNLGSIKIYPNPTNAILHISSSIPITEVSLYNSMGQEIINLIDKDGVRQINVSALASGIYFVRLKNGEGGWNYKKIIKK